MFQSRISGAARGAGKTFLSERTVAKLIERATAPDEVEMVLIDLTLNTIDLGLDIPLLHQSFVNCRVVAYGPHVDVERLALAQESGADEVLTRGQMDRNLNGVIQGA